MNEGSSRTRAKGLAVGREGVKPARETVRPTVRGLAPRIFSALDDGKLTDSQLGALAAILDIALSITARKIAGNRRVDKFDYSKGARVFFDENDIFFSIHGTDGKEYISKIGGLMTNSLDNYYPKMGVIYLRHMNISAEIDNNSVLVVFSKQERSKEPLERTQRKLRTREHITEPFRLTGGTDQLIQVLDQIKAAIEQDSELRAAFATHALNQGKHLQDPVASEIAAEVTDRWERRKLDHPGEAWIKNPVKFVSHVYKKWLDAGTLKQAHLKHDEELYFRYSKHISLRPDDDLKLGKSPGGRPKAIAPKLQN